MMKKFTKTIATLLLVGCMSAGAVGLGFAVTEQGKANAGGTYTGATGNADRSFEFTKENMDKKAFAFYGDSITAGLGLKANDKDYMELLQEEFGFYYYNAAVSGASVTEAAGKEGDLTANTVYAQLSKSEYIYRDADYVSIFLGTNDWGYGRALGTKDSPADSSTICGAYKQVIERIISANPDVKIMIMTPLGRWDTWSGGFQCSPTVNNFAATPYTLNQMTAALKEIGAMYHCKVVDLSSVVTESNRYQYLIADQIHVTPAGYQAIANAIKNA
ncbi:MAG: SGNH/GDSL hydrolase family protein [Clostridia bacterium]|nr:SGNH/GDSL hydrolase family protein [Clostridia bacterium]